MIGGRDFHIRIGDVAGNYYKYTASATLLTSANLIWKQYKVPLAGNSQFNRTTVGTMSLDKVNYVEFHADTWDYGYTLWLDGVQFQPCSPVTAVPPKTGAGTNSLQIRPNPSDGNAWISFQLEEGGNIFLEMFDAQGTKVSTLADGYRQPRNYSLPVSKEFLSSGIYIIRLTTPAGSGTKRLVVCKIKDSSTISTQRFCGKKGMRHKGPGTRRAI